MKRNPLLGLTYFNSTMAEKTNLLKRTWLTGVIFIVLIFLFFIAPKIAGVVHATNEELEILKHLLLTLMAIMGVHLLERAFLWKEIANWNKDSLTTVLQDANALIKAADTCGLQTIYPSREEARKDVINDVRKAKKRIWLLGVGLSQKININHDLMDLIKAKIRNNGEFDVRILMLDALRSTAVFRTFLESKGEEVKSVIDVNLKDRKKPPIDNPYFHLTLYKDFQHGFSSFKSSPELKAVIRFYPNTPVCWLAVIDDTSYFQPYTFGRTVGSELTIGNLLPVFKFKSESDRSIFEVLEDHFNKLWLTSNTDLFHVGAIITDKERIIHDIFKNRSAWLKHIYGSLYHPSNRGVSDRRKYPRRPCRSDIQVKVEFSNAGEAEKPVTSDIVNFSREGIALNLRNEDLTEGCLVKLSVVAPELQSRAAEYFREELLGPTNGAFRVVHSSNDSFIGLAAQP
jgi:hypothetical protein